MPHAVFNVGSQSATGDFAPRSLVPGVEPGGSRAGQETKPALLIRDAWVEVIDIGASSGAANWTGLSVFLKLSQEMSLDPGLLLLVHQWSGGTRADNAGSFSAFTSQGYGDRLAGTVWAPRVVGVRIAEIGAGLVDWDLDVHLEYERVDVPWMDWFIMWEFLDGVVNNEREY